MPTNYPDLKSFAIKDCALIAIATGRRAQNLRELRNLLAEINPDSIYYHFWGGLLRPRFDDPEYHNDFAIWTRHGLHDKILAERLSIIDPTEYNTIEDLRQELIDRIEERLDEIDYPLWAKHDNQFEFVRSQIVIFDTHFKINRPEELVKFLPRMTVGSIFYHFIDARRRNAKGMDDFQNWIKDFGKDYQGLCSNINEIDPYFATLAELRNKLIEVLNNFLKNANNGSNTFKICRNSRA